jgi:hypothetical protein
MGARLIRNGAEYTRTARIVHRLALRGNDIDAGEEAYLGVGGVGRTDA